MTVHPEFLELISTSLDREISEGEQRRLDDHLWNCAACRDAGEQLRSRTAAHVPAPAPYSARSEQSLLAAIRRTTASQRWAFLGATVMLATVSTFLVGGILLDADEPGPSAGPSASLATRISPSSSDKLETGGPTAIPPAPPTNAMATVRPANGTRPPATQALAFPIAYDADLAGVRLAPTRDDRLWVSFGRGPDTILALLDQAGEPVDGWPLELPFTQGCVPLGASDGSLRLLCNVSDVDPDHCLDICEAQVVLAFDAAGAELEGWPVSFGVAFERAVHAETARMVGDDVYLIESFGSEESDPETGRYGSARLLRIMPNGTVVAGDAVPGPEACCAISPEGVAFGRSTTYGDGDVPTASLVAFDQSGVLPGWPVDFVGDVSMPGFGQNGALAIATWGDSEGLSELRWLGRDGLPWAEADVTQLDGTEWDAIWGGPMSPLVDDSNRAFVIVGGRILAFDGGGAPLPGWPYEPQTAIRTEGGCGEGDTGCPYYVILPVVDHGLLYVLETGERENGGRVTAVQADGSIRGDWPVILKRPGASFDSIVLSETGLAFAVAREPESGGTTSSTILAITEDGNVRWATTVLQP